MTDLWTNAQVARHFGVSESRARHILADHGIQRVYGYPASEVKAIQRPGQGARTDLKEHTVTTTSGVEYGSWNADMTDTPGDYVRAFLGDFVDDYDVEGLVRAFLAAINARLSEHGISLAGREFYGDSEDLSLSDARDLIWQAIEDVDLGELAETFNKS